MALEKLGRYEILDELGKGAMGVVYLARDPLIGRQLAIKTFNVGLSAGDEELEKFKARFLREAQSAGILNHPNIVTIHDVVVGDGGAIFIAMEYVKGTDLKLLMQRQARLEPSFVVDVVAQIADGLDYAHQKGVVHRDVKPANVILTADKQAKITDFGIAHLDASNLTTEGQLLGTPNYMSPEMIRGETVDHRADIFSLGVVLYEMLTRKKPFHGNNLTVVTHKIVYEPFTPPGEIVAGLPPALGAVLDRALAKDPETRYARAGEMAEDLRAALAPAAAKPHATSSGSFLAAGLAVPAPPVTMEAGSSPPAAAPPVAVSPAAVPGASAARRSSKAPWILGAGLLLVVAVAGFLAVTMRGGGAGLSAAGPRQAAPQPAAPPAVLDPEAELRERYQPHVDDGQRLLAAGDPRGAVAAFEKALAVAPGNRELLELRQQAEDEALRKEGIDPEALALERHLAAARAALAERDYELAIQRAQKALDLDAGNAAARKLVSQAEDGQRRRDQVRDRFRTGGGAVAETPPPSPPPGGSRPAARVGKARLHVDFRAQVPEGRITIYAEQERLYQDSFKFGEQKTGLFRRSSEPVSGQLTGDVEMPAGKTKLLVYVKLKDVEATLRDELPADLPVGGSATLEIVVDAGGRLRASLK